MHALIKENKVEKYPYGISNLRKDNRNVSFPKNVTDEIFAQYGVVRVFFSTQPEITYAQNIQEGIPVFDGERWNQTWIVVNFSEEELAYRSLQKAEEIRAARNEELLKTDWTMLSDAPIENLQIWINYRQALRDVTKQIGFPWDVVFPEKPT
jgi:hypothetical protein